MSNNECLIEFKIKFESEKDMITPGTKLSKLSYTRDHTFSPSGEDQGLLLIALYQRVARCCFQSFTLTGVDIYLDLPLPIHINSTPNYSKAQPTIRTAYIHNGCS